MVGQLRPKNCLGCPYKSRTCGSKGPIDSPYVIVGESPGSNEIITGLPFSGPSGKVIEEALQGGIPPLYLNAVSCLPKNKDSDNLATACQACNSRLIEEIKAYPRKAILAMGNAAVWSLTGNYDSKITQVRGRIFISPLAEQGIIACVHPAFLLRGGGSSRLFRRDVQLSEDLGSGGDSPFKYKETECILMETESDIRELIDLGSSAPLIAADLETTGLSPRVNTILSHGFCFEPTKAYIVPPHLHHLIGPMYNPSVVSGRYIWQNGKFDVGFLRADFEKTHSNWRSPDYRRFYLHDLPNVGNRWGFQFARAHEDTMLLSYCLDENNGIHGLEVLGNDLLSAPNWKGALDKYLPKQGDTYAKVPPNTLYRYQAKDLGVTFQIFPLLRSQVAKDPLLEKLYTQHLMSAQEELVFMEAAGMPAEPEAFKRNKVWFGFELQCAENSFQKIAKVTLGTTVNPNSWQQVQKLLYVGGLDIAKGKILGTGKDELRLFPNAPGVKELQAIRKLKKLYSTYITSMEEAIEPDGNIHTTYKLHATTTGRLASSDPVNLQNIIRNDLIKNQFWAGFRKWLLSIDLSQAELRVLACLSLDKTLLEIFRSGVSIHPIVAKRFYGEHYTEDEYQLAKAVTFGIVYGRDAYSIALEYQITPKAAEEYIESWFGQFPDAKKFIERCRDAPIQGKILKTPWGRKRRYGIVGVERYNAVGNEAANFPPQSMASDITLETLYTVGPQLRKWGVLPSNIVHDDIISLLRQDEQLLRDTVKLVTGVMEEVPRKKGLTAVPFVAEWKVGTHWGQLTKSSKLPLDFFEKVRYNNLSAGDRGEQLDA